MVKVTREESLKAIRDLDKHIKRLQDKEYNRCMMYSRRNPTKIEIYGFMNDVRYIMNTAADDHIMYTILNNYPSSVKQYTYTNKSAIDFMTDWINTVLSECEDTEHRVYLTYQPKPVDPIERWFAMCK